MPTPLLLLPFAAASTPPPIIDGELFTDLPAVVAVTAQLEDDPTDVWAFCSGVLVDPEWVLTAAHCVANLEAVWDEYGVIGVSVSFGEDAEAADALVVPMSEWIAHPEYGPNTDGSAAHDIALIKLSRSITSVEPVSAVGAELPSRADGSELFRVSGFGQSTDSGGGGVRLFADLALTYLTEGFLWLKDADGGQNVCYGDSGGPTLLPGKNGGWEVAAVSSQLVIYDASHPCEGNGVISTRLDIELDWVESYVDLLAYDEWYTLYGTTDPEPEDTGTVDTGEPDDTGEADSGGDDSGDSDTGEPGSGDTAAKAEEPAACGCTHGGGLAAGAAVALAGLLARRRRL